MLQLRFFFCFPFPRHRLRFMAQLFATASANPQRLMAASPSSAIVTTAREVSLLQEQPVEDNATPPSQRLSQGPSAGVVIGRINPKAKQSFLQVGPKQEGATERDIAMYEVTDGAVSRKQLSLSGVTAELPPPPLAASNEDIEFALANEDKVVLIRQHGGIEAVTLGATADPAGVEWVTGSLDSQASSAAGRKSATTTKKQGRASAATSSASQASSVGVIDLAVLAPRSDDSKGYLFILAEREQSNATTTEVVPEGEEAPKTLKPYLVTLQATSMHTQTFEEVRLQAGEILQTGTACSTGTGTFITNRACYVVSARGGSSCDRISLEKILPAAVVAGSSKIVDVVPFTDSLVLLLLVPISGKGTEEGRGKVHLLQWDTARPNEVATVVAAVEPPTTTRASASKELNVHLAVDSDSTICFLSIHRTIFKIALETSRVPEAHSKRQGTHLTSQEPKIDTGFSACIFALAERRKLAPPPDQVKLVLDALKAPTGKVSAGSFVDSAFLAPNGSAVIAALGSEAAKAGKSSGSVQAYADRVAKYFASATMIQSITVLHSVSELQRICPATEKRALFEGLAVLFDSLRPQPKLGGSMIAAAKAQLSLEQSVELIPALYGLLLHAFEATDYVVAQHIATFIDALLVSRASEGISSRVDPAVLTGLTQALTSISRFTLSQPAVNIGQLTAHSGPESKARKEPAVVPYTAYRVKTGFEAKVWKETVRFQ